MIAVRWATDQLPAAGKIAQLVEQAQWNRTVISSNPVQPKNFQACLQLRKMLV